MEAVDVVITRHQTHPETNFLTAASPDILDGYACPREHTFKQYRTQPPPVHVCIRSLLLAMTSGSCCVVCSSPLHGTHNSVGELDLCPGSSLYGSVSPCEVSHNAHLMADASLMCCLGGSGTGPLLGGHMQRRCCFMGLEC